MDGGRRKLRSLDGPLTAVGGAGSSGAGHTRALYSSRPLKPAALRAEPIAYRAPVRSAAQPRRAQLSHNPVIADLIRPGMGWLGVFMLFVCTGIYGTTIGGRWQDFGYAATSVPDAVARGTGFTIANVDVQGRKILTDAEILAALDHDSGRSLVFLDVNAARERLMQNPLVLSATVRKLYPDNVAITVVEREPYALWQRGEKMSVIAQDGTVIDGVEEGRFANLPLLVGQGADASAKAMLAALEPYPELRKDIYAMVRVGDRRWNLRLTNGMDVKLPEEGYADAITAFVKLDAAEKLKERDITEVDLRRPGHTTVRLSDDAAAAELAAKPKEKAAGT
jgi:cell division protein FtsQ